MYRDNIELVFWTTSGCAVPLNLLIVTAIIKEKCLRANPPNYYIIALAVVSVLKVSVYASIVSSSFASQSK
jgi:hypothetical protein